MSTQATQAKEIETDPIVITISLVYIIYVCISIYLICELRSIDESKTEDLRGSVWKFMFMSNNGFFIMSVCYSPMLHDTTIGYIVLIVSGIVLVVTTIYCLIKFCSAVIFQDFYDKFLCCSFLGYWYGIPCKSIWPFLGLTEPCCTCNSYTVTTYADGHIESDKNIVICWNTFMLILKRVVIFIMTIIYYVCLIALTIIWLIVKLIFAIVKSCNERKAENDSKNENNKVVDSKDAKGNNSGAVNVVNTATEANNIMNDDQGNVGNIGKNEVNVENKKNIEVKEENNAKEIPINDLKNIEVVNQENDGLPAPTLNEGKTVTPSDIKVEVK